MNQHNVFPWEILPWIAVVFSIINMWGNFFMGLEDISVSIWVAIISAVATLGAAIIAAAVALFGQWRQAKRDGKTINNIKENTSNTLGIVGNIADMSKSTSNGINALISDLEHRKRMEAQFPQSISGKDLITAGSNRMLEENAQLNRQYHELNILYLKAQDTISELRTENVYLKDKIQLLNQKLQAYHQEQDHGYYEPEL